MADKEEVKEMLEDLLESFKEKVKKDDKVKKRLEDFNRNIAILFEDDGDYSFTLSDGEVSKIKEGKTKSADITITTDSVTLNALIEGDMKAMEAYARKKIRVDAPFMDLLKIKDMF